MGLLFSAVPQAIRRRLCAAHAGLIAVLSLVPAWMFPPSTGGVPGLDKAVHFVLYGVLGALLRWAQPPGRSGRRGAAWVAVAAGYGLLMEVLQLTLCAGSRGFSWRDALANTAGAAVGWLAIQWSAAPRI
ncbi:MAG TPA: VanZ family protein [Kiritimatiellia bacterium]|nr:VanZ family protein [Kiritimatiellia bacterium]